MICVTTHHTDYAIPAPHVRGLGDKY